MEQHEVQGVICSIQVIEPLQTAVAILNLDVPLAGCISLTITCVHMHPHSQRSDGARHRGIQGA
jgi:hypothetical protein